MANLPTASDSFKDSLPDASPAAGAEPALRGELAALSEPERQVALERFQMLRPHLEEGAALTIVAQEANLSYRTAVRWVSLYRRFGLAALARKGRADRGKRRALSPEMTKVVEGLALQKPPLPVAALYRQVFQLAQQQGQKPPSYSMVYDVVRKIPHDLVTLAHEGTKAYAERFELLHRREAERSNAVWQADHTLLDVLVLREEGEAARPWLTIIQDDYSRAVAGYYLSFEPPSILRTALALRQAIWRKQDARWRICGIPEVFYTDNGSDFTSVHLQQVAADLKMRLVFSTPGKPRGRGRIERFFATLSQRCLCELPGYLVRGGGIRGKPRLTLPELDAILGTFLLEIYHLEEHSQTGQTPQARWESGGFLPQTPTSLEQLDLLLLTVAKSRKVHPDGIRFQGFRYVDPTLAAFVGESVILRYDPRDLAEVRLFHQGRFLCRAICPDLASETVGLREIVRARTQRRRELRMGLRERQKSVATLLDLKRGSAEGVTDAAEELADEKVTDAKPADSAVLPRPDAAPPLRRYLNE